MNNLSINNFSSQSNSYRVKQVSAVGKTVYRCSRASILLFCFWLFCQHVIAQSCNCNYTITSSGSYDAKLLGYKAGQTICVASGNYTYLTFRNLLGTASAPIKIINCGGPVTVGSTTAQSGIVFWDSRYVKLTGTGDPLTKYGINVNQTPDGVTGINVTGFSSDFEIEKVEVSGTGFAGIMVKQDPTCDPATWRGNFTMYNIKVHDNYLHDTGSEGLYIGNSFWNSGMTRTCDGTTITVYPHNINGLQIYNNLTERTGAEGIQYACAPDVKVYNNVVKNAGYSPFAAYQNNGIQGSGGIAGRVYNNMVLGATGNGFNIIGHSGTNMFYNNLVTDVGGAGFFCDNRAGTLTKNAVIFTSNTIINTGLEGFRLYNDLDNVTVSNNAVIQSALGKLLYQKSTMNAYQPTNYYAASLSTTLNAKIFDSNYRPLAGSPLIDKGTLNSYWGITIDLDGKPRLAGTTIDIGAYEFQPVASARSGTEVAGSFGGEGVIMKEVSSYPSPCIDELVLKLTNPDLTMSEVSIYAMDGSKVNHIIPAMPANEIRVATGTLPTGLYVFRVMTPEAKQLNGRFVKL